jgi:hypothetical protein
MWIAVASSEKRRAGQCGWGSSLAVVRPWKGEGGFHDQGHVAPASCGRCFPGWLWHALILGGVGHQGPPVLPALAARLPCLGVATCWWVDIRSGRKGARWSCALSGLRLGPEGVPRRALDGVVCLVLVAVCRVLAVQKKQVPYLGPCIRIHMVMVVGCRHDSRLPPFCSTACLSCWFNYGIPVAGLLWAETGESRDHGRVKAGKAAARRRKGEEKGGSQGLGG